MEIKVVQRVKTQVGRFSFHLVHFCILLIFLCFPAQTFFIENKQLIDGRLYFCKQDILLFPDIVNPFTKTSCYSLMHVSVAFCHSPEWSHTETLLPLQLWYPCRHRWITTLWLCHTTSALVRKGIGPHLAGKQSTWLVSWSWEWRVIDIYSTSVFRFPSTWTALTSWRMVALKVKRLKHTTL